MDTFEQILERLIDNVVQLQNSQSESFTARKVTRLYPVVLKIRDDLQSLHKNGDQDHPLKTLAQEVRGALRNREFNALLLAAFNWRSVSKPRKKIPKPVTAREAAARANFGSASCKRHKKPKQKKRRSRQHSEAPLTPEQQAQVQRYTQKFMRDLDAFLATPAAKAMRTRAAKDKAHVDIFRAGRRLPGSFGART